MAVINNPCIIWDQNQTEIWHKYCHIQENMWVAAFACWTAHLFEKINGGMQWEPIHYIPIRDAYLPSFMYSSLVFSYD